MTKSNNQQQPCIYVTYACGSKYEELTVQSRKHNLYYCDSASGHVWSDEHARLLKDGTKEQIKTFVRSKFIYLLNENLNDLIDNDLVKATKLYLTDKDLFCFDCDFTGEF